MSVLTDAQRAANAFVDERRPDRVVDKVPMWAWGALYDAFMAGANFERQQCAEYIRERSGEIYGADANVVEHEEAALWVLKKQT